MKVCVVTGSRADRGLLEWPIKKLEEDGSFEVRVLSLWGCALDEAMRAANEEIGLTRPDVMMMLGDRFEILGAATAAHLARVPIAHLCGGDVTEGSYDDAMRDCISRMATVHFVTSTSAMARLSSAGYRNVHLVGNPGIDYIKHADWKKDRPIEKPYVVISYQPETLDRVNEIGKVLQSLPAKHKVFILPNPDLGSGDITNTIRYYASERNDCTVHECLEHAEFLNLLAHCDEFIGNSSAMLYEAPELGVKTRMIGKRQRGRTIPMGDGLASDRIVKILKYASV